MKQHAAMVCIAIATLGLVACTGGGGNAPPTSRELAHTLTSAHVCRNVRPDSNSVLEGGQRCVPLPHFETNARVTVWGFKNAEARKRSQRAFLEHVCRKEARFLEGLTHHPVDLAKLGPARFAEGQWWFAVAHGASSGSLVQTVARVLDGEVVRRKCP